MPSECAPPTSRPSASSSGASPPPRSRSSRAARAGHPLVIRNAPVDATGDPFPTIYWLTCPEAVQGVSRVSSPTGWIGRLNERFDGRRRVRAPTLRARPRRGAAERERMAARARELGRRRRHARGREVPARALRVPPRGRRRLRSARGWPSGSSRSTPEAPSGRVAAIDQGTNSIRLLVLERRTDDGSDGARARHGHHAARAGRGRDGPLDPGALERTRRRCLGTLLPPRAGARRRADPRGGHQRRARRRRTGEAFAAAVRATMRGPTPRSSPANEEAGLSFLGGTRGLDRRRTVPRCSTSAAARPSSSWARAGRRRARRSARRWGAFG